MISQTASNKKGANSSELIAFILISLGFIFILNNFEILPWQIWEVIWKFWPMLLIIWGLKLLLGNSRVANLILVATTIILFGLILTFALPQINSCFNSWLQQYFDWWPYRFR